MIKMCLKYSKKLNECLRKNDLFPWKTLKKDFNRSYAQKLWTSVDNFQKVNQFLKVMSIRTEVCKVFLLAYKR